MLLAGLLVFGIVLAVAGIGGGLSALFHLQQNAGRVDPRPIVKAILILYGALILIGVLLGPAFHALITNLIWNNTRLGEHRIECNMSPLGLIWITVSNFVLVIVTLGMFIPWAMVRVTRFQLESMRLIPASDLQEFVAAAPEDVGAIGSEATSAFDFDIAL
jgi:uncharacterized membrane protein YjgN (DUF898 family)